MPTVESPTSGSPPRLRADHPITSPTAVQDSSAPLSVRSFRRIKSPSELAGRIEVARRLKRLEHGGPIDLERLDHLARRHGDRVRIPAGPGISARWRRSRALIVRFLRVSGPQPRTIIRYNAVHTIRPSLTADEFDAILEGLVSDGVVALSKVQRLQYPGASMTPRPFVETVYSLAERGAA